MITANLVQAFKNRMHITHDIEDDNLKKMLSSSFIYVKTRVGEFDLDGEEEHDIQATELVLERARYVYNDAVEYFEDNFLSQITALGIMAGDDDVEE